MFPVSLKGWEVLSMMASSLVSILCSTTSYKVANRGPTTEPAFLIILFSLLVSFALMCVPQYTIPKNMVLATTDW